MKIVIHFKSSNLANAPDEIYNLLKKYENDDIKFFLIQWDIKRLGQLLVQYKGNDIYIHFHNKRVRVAGGNIAKHIIQFHSEPQRVDLKSCIENKYVLNQYHCTLPQYADCKLVRNFFINDQPIKFYPDAIKIGYYPSTTTPINKYYDKGYGPTTAILQSIKKKFGPLIEIDVVTGISYKKCIERKRDCHIIIDECVTGSFHKSTIEGLTLGCLVFVWISPELQQVHMKNYGQTLPVINTPINKLEGYLSKCISLGRAKIEEVAMINHRNFKSYWGEEQVAREYLEIYDYHI